MGLISEHFEHRIGDHRRWQRHSSGLWMQDHGRNARNYMMMLPQGPVRLFSAGLKTSTAPFVPTDIAGCVLWLKADAGLYQDAAKTTPVASDGDVVGAWSDQSGNGNDATQATTAYKPLYKVSILNGLPVVRFDGSDALAHTYNRGPNPATAFAVVQRNGGVAGVQFVVQCSDGPSIGMSAHIHARVASNVNWGAYFNTWCISSYSIDATWAVLACVVRSGTDIDLVTNGNIETFVGAGYYSDANPNRKSVGSGSVTPNESLTGDIAEILYYDTALSDANRALVEAYLNTRWAIY